jgi:Flp pilus assembly protein TadD
LLLSYDQLGRFDLADRAYAQAERIRGPSAQTYNNRGYSYLLRGDAAAARLMFDRARRSTLATRSSATTWPSCALAPDLT